MNEGEQLLRLATAIGIGLLIGIERGWQSRGAEPGERVAGVRTYSLIGLLGGAAAIVSERLGAVVLGATLIGLTAALVTAFILGFRLKKDVGITSLVASLVTFALGALAGLGYVESAAAAAIAATMLLGFKPELHRWVESLSGDELRAGLKLLVISVVLLPVLPNRGYGPWQAVNPYQLWWMVVLIATISFVGYFAVKLIGASRGILFTGFFGGLSSSTGLTLHLSRTAKRAPKLHDVLAAAVLLACGTVFPRLAVITGLLSPPLARAAAVPFTVMAAVVYVAALVLWRRQPGVSVDHETILANPLELKSALSFGLLLAVIMLLARGLNEWFGDTGLLALSAASGIADVDAIALSLARMSNDGVALRTAVVGLVVAASVNNLVKGGMTLFVGGAKFGWRAGVPLLLSAAAGIATAALW